MMGWASLLVSPSTLFYPFLPQLQQQPCLHLMSSQPRMQFSVSSTTEILTQQQQAGTCANGSLFRYDVRQLFTFSRCACACSFAFTFGLCLRVNNSKSKMLLIWSACFFTEASQRLALLLPVWILFSPVSMERLGSWSMQPAASEGDSAQFGCLSLHDLAQSGSRGRVVVQGSDNLACRMACFLKLLNLFRISIQSRAHKKMNPGSRELHCAKMLN